GNHERDLLRLPPTPGSELSASPQARRSPTLPRHGSARLPPGEEIPASPRPELPPYSYRGIHPLPSAFIEGNGASRVPLSTSEAVRSAFKRQILGSRGRHAPSLPIGPNPLSISPANTWHCQ